MRGNRLTATEQEAPHSVIAAFDDWTKLDAALAAMDANETCSYCAVLHARGEVRSEACDAVNEITRLAFTASRTCVIRSEGALSHALAEALKHGTHSLADALRQWVSGEQARQLEDHITRGPAANARPSSAGFAAISYARRRTWSRSAKAEPDPQPRARQ